MPIAPLLIAAFLAVPLIEVALFVQVGGWIGLWPTLLAIVLTAVVGSIVIRRQGSDVARKARARLDAGTLPVEEGFTGLCLFVAGLLMVTPGFFTDAIGALLLVPAVRHALYQRLRRHVRVVDGTAGEPRPTPPGDVIEGEYEVVDDDPRAMPPPRGGWDGDDRR
jgi:UPF0716 protein FxsA